MPNFCRALQMTPQKAGLNLPGRLRPRTRKFRFLRPPAGLTMTAMIYSSRYPTDERPAPIAAARKASESRIRTGDRKMKAAFKTARDATKVFLLRPAGLKMAVSPVKSYLIPIRALTDVGKAGLKEEDIRRTYGQAVESVLQKEDIPLNYREYIKNYFMAIGLNTED
ncbi:MAG: hypothetical protein P8X90_32255 [Desulfobacterales bacterium]